MDNFDLAYEQALAQVELSITEILDTISMPGVTDIGAIDKISSSLDAWDYCYAIAIGLAGVFISTNEKFAQYIDEIHKTASGASGNYDLFQTFLGKALQHKGDYIDSVGGTFKNRNGENADALFHRLLWGHDILALGKDNPFRLMFNQKGLFGILQAVRHLIADTASKQGLPLPGSSLLDVVDENNKTSNYLIKLARQLSTETVGNKMKAQEIYAHLATIRAQDIAAGVVVKTVSELYFKMRRVTDDIRCCEIRLIAYAVNFFGEAVAGCIRQNGVPYINTPLALVMGTSFAKFCYLNSKEIKQLTNITAELSAKTQEALLESKSIISIMPELGSADAYIRTYQQAENNVNELLYFLEEGAQ